MTDILGADQFGRLIDPRPEPAPEPETDLVNGRPAEEWERDSRRAAILADRERERVLLSGLVRSS